MKIREILQETVMKFNDNNIQEPIIKARILLAYVLNVSKEYLIIHSEDEIDIKFIKKYYKTVNKIINGVPLQYITNEQEFMKMKFYVDENVLIPRPDTEILAEEVINNCNKKVEKRYEILDLCSGSGAIGISLAKYIKNSNVVCADISENALEISKKNAELNQIENIKFIKSDMFNNISNKFDIIVSNPPYIKKEIIPTLDKEVQKEPYIALNGGEDGLDFYKIIIEKACDYLKKEGGLFLEIGYDQKNEVIKLCEKRKKYKQIYSKKDLYGNDRIVVAFL